MVMASLREIPELRRLFEAARKYLIGELSICELNGTVNELKALAKFGRSAAPIHELLKEWECMVNRRWNEWLLEKEPLCEEQFAEWIREQLVFDDDDC